MTALLTAAQAQARADRGAALLDRKRPGWWREIDEKRLDMASALDCVLGQIFGTFTDGMVELHPLASTPVTTFSVREGFDLRHPFRSAENWAMRRCAWLNAIAARREGARDA